MFTGRKNWRKSQGFPEGIPEGYRSVGNFGKLLSVFPDSQREVTAMTDRIGHLARKINPRRKK